MLLKTSGVLIAFWYINIDPENHRFSAASLIFQPPNHARVVMLSYQRVCCKPQIIGILMTRGSQKQAMARWL